MQNNRGLSLIALNDELKNYLDMIIGMPCWAVVAGAGTGSMVLLSFGKKIPRDTPISNIYICHDARHFDAELSLFIMNAEWQLLDSNNNNYVLCDCYSSNIKNEEMDKGLLKLVNKNVKSTMIDFNGYDFEIHFDEGLILCVIERDDKNSDYEGYNFNEYHKK